MNRLPHPTSLVARVSASVAAAAVMGLIAPATHAVVVTITDSPTPANVGLVVFDSAGFDNQLPGALGAPATGSYSNTGAGYSSSVLSGPATPPSATLNAPSAAYSGPNYQSISRGATGTSFQFYDFSQAIDTTTESFTIEYAFFGMENAAAFGVGTASLTNSAAAGNAEQLSTWRWNANLPGSKFGQYGTTSETDDLPTLLYYAEDWNTFVYAFDAATKTASFTLNGETASAIIQDGFDTGGQTLAQRLLVSPGAANTALYVDSIPEPATLGLLAVGGLAMLGGRTRKDRD